MNIISQILENENNKSFSINKFFKENNISGIMKQCNFNKEKGIKSIIVFKLIFILLFTNKSLFRLLSTKKDSINFSKDVVYRFLNSVHYNWSKLLIILSSNIIKLNISKLTSEERVNVLIVDDSTYSRNRSKNVELLARVKDNVLNKYVKGFKMLTLGWSDGNSFIPIAFNILSSLTEKNQLCPINKNIDKRSNGYKIRKSALQKKTDAMIKLLEQAKKYQIPAKYVLFDSWFTFPSVISKVVALKFDVIAMVKKMSKTYYNFQGKLMNLENIYATLSKKRGKAKILASTIVTITTENNETISLKIVFVRNRNKKKEWLALLTSDTTLSDEEVVRIYGKRWDIEVFFKICKSYLNLGKEFQGRSYDSIFSHTTIVFVRYIMLAVENRENNDSRSIGGLFYEYCDELTDLQFSQSLDVILEILISAIKHIFSATKEQLDKLVSYFFDNSPNSFKGLGMKLYCET